MPKSRIKKRICCKFIRHNSVLSALHHITELRLRDPIDNEDLRYYWCKQCNAYHVGHPGYQR